MTAKFSPITSCNFHRNVQSVKSYKSVSKEEYVSDTEHKIPRATKAVMLYVRLLRRQSDDQGGGFLHKNLDVSCGRAFQ